MTFKHLLLAACALAVTGPALAQETDGIKLPPGFHATVVADHLGVLRHIAFRDNDNLYVSTQWNNTGTSGDVIAIHLGKDRVADKTQHFGAMMGGTGLAFYRGALYAASTARVYRYNFHGNSLTPDSEPVIVIDGMAPTRNTARGLAFDGKGNLFVSLGATQGANMCVNGNSKTGLKPCPLLETRSGIWRFSASKLNQQFPKDGEKFATGIRDMGALTWSPTDNALYGIMHGRDNTARDFPAVVSPAEDDAIADEMHKVVKGTDFGWPYTYYDGVRKIRLTAPEYGGDNKTAAPSGQYSTPVATFQMTRSSPLDLAFYTGKMFPAAWRGGAFITRHGSAGPKPNNKGYDVIFIPFDKNGVAGPEQEFATGFAGPTQAEKTAAKAKYRPVGAAVAPDGSLFVTDSSQGRIWRIAYTGN